MTQPLFQFGQQLPQYNVPVMNERAVRASAGLLFMIGLVAFMNAWLLGNFALTRVFVVVFLVDFAVRILLNPQLAPTLIIGQWVVRQQQPDYVGAPQKRFAWVIGFVLALAMLYLVVLNNVIGPVNLIVCALCLTLMFFESAFGICLGCKLYNLLQKQKAQLCPGGLCDTDRIEPVRTSPAQWLAVVLYAALVLGVWQSLGKTSAPPALAAPASQGSAASDSPIDPVEAERCKVPDFAKALGHEAMWKLHNHCR